MTTYCRLFIAGFILSILISVLLPNMAFAGGGVVLKDDQCTISIAFYSAHFTAYQPDTSGNKEFCEDLPDTGPTIFVLDYLHNSLKEVPVDFRILRNVTEMGKFAKLEHIRALGDLAQHTVFYQRPTTAYGGSFTVEHAFAAPGDYVGLVSAGHPTNDKTYYAVFPFSVGAVSYGLWISAFGLMAAAALLFLRWNRSRQPTRRG